MTLECDIVSKSDIYSLYNYEINSGSTFVKLSLWQVYYLYSHWWVSELTDNKVLYYKFYETNKWKCKIGELI